MNIGMSEITALALGMLLGMALELLFDRSSRKRERKAWEQWQKERLADLKGFQKREDVVVSGQKERINFVTLDNGRTWYQYEVTDDGGKRIVFEGKIPQPALTQAIQNQLAIEQAVARGLLF